jgi:hypothetical protein
VATPATQSQSLAAQQNQSQNIYAAQNVKYLYRDWICCFHGAGFMTACSFMGCYQRFEQFSCFHAQYISEDQANKFFLTMK